jgi:hypothetical protein
VIYNIAYSLTLIFNYHLTDNQFFSLFEYLVDILYLFLILDHVFPMLSHQLIVHFPLPLLPLLVLSLHLIDHSIQALAILDVLLPFDAFLILLRCNLLK